MTTTRHLLWLALGGRNVLQNFCKTATNVGIHIYIVIQVKSPRMWCIGVPWALQSSKLKHKNHKRLSHYLRPESRIKQSLLVLRFQTWSPLLDRPLWKACSWQVVNACPCLDNQRWFVASIHTRSTLLSFRSQLLFKCPSGRSQPQSGRPRTDKILEKLSFSPSISRYNLKRTLSSLLYHSQQLMLESFVVPKEGKPDWIIPLVNLFILGGGFSSIP